MNPFSLLWKSNDKDLTKMDPVSELRRFSIFVYLCRAQILKLKSHLHARKLSAGEKFFEKGQSGYAIYLVTNGTAQVFYEDPSDQNLIAKISAGEFFGEVALLNPETGRSATVIAESEVDCFALFRSDLDLLSDEDPELGLFIYRELARVLSKRLTQTILHFMPEKPNDIPPT